MHGQRLDLEPPPFAFETATVHYAADRPVRPTHVRIEVALDFDKQSLTGVCTTKLKAVRQLDAIAFDAVELEVDACEVDGKRADFDNDGARLLVHKALKAGAEATVVVRYRCTPRRGLYFIAPDKQYPARPVQAWTQGQDED